MQVLVKALRYSHKGLWASSKGYLGVWLSGCLYPQSSRTCLMMCIPQAVR